MAAFNSSTSVRRTISDPGTDCRLPGSASLSWQSVTVPTALKSTTGASSELLHGDRWQQTNGNHEATILRNQRQTVEGSQTIVIAGTHKETIVEHCCQSIIGPHLVTNHTVRNETRMGGCNIIYGLLTYRDITDGRFLYSWTYFTTALVMNFELDAIKVEVQGSHLEAAPFHFEFKGVKFERDISDFSVDGGILRAAITKTDVAGLVNDVKGVTNEISLRDSQIADLTEDAQLIDLVVGDLCAAQKTCVNSSPHSGPYA